MTFSFQKQHLTKTTYIAIFYIIAQIKYTIKTSLSVKYNIYTISFTYIF